MRRRNWNHGGSSAAMSFGAKDGFSIPKSWRRYVVMTVVGLVTLAYACLVLASGWIVSSKSNSNSHPLLDDKRSGERPRQVLEKVTTSTKQATSPMRYNDWREVAVRLAKLLPSEALIELKTKDPFQTRSFAQRVEQAAATNPLSLDDFKKLFGKCPIDRLSLPDQRDQQKASDFRNGQDGTFLFFQHLRKAGGTHFCTLAEHNFPKQNLPPYYCMPDYHWPRDADRIRREGQQACAGCLHHWSNDEILSHMKPHRIAGNEWDAFDPSRHFELPAVFVTSFRKPLDRALSQYRFECVEERGCQIKDVGEYWTKRRDLYNVYTWTFSDVGRQAFIATDASKAAAEQRATALGKALDTLAKFNLVLAMEWIVYAESSVQSVLGFEDTTTLQRHVRPLNEGKKRNDTWKPEDYLTKEQYVQFSQNLALDEILTDAAHRLFLERLVCDEL